MKIVSLLPSATEIVCALGLEKDLVAITHECDFPPSISHLPVITASRISHETMTSSEIDHAVRSQLDGHGSIYDLDTELLERLGPDLLLTQELCDVCAVSYKQVEKAARMYVADSTVVSLEPNTIDGIFETIKTVGDLTEVPEKAAEVIEILRSRLDRVKKRSHNECHPTVFMLEWLEPPFAPGHWVPEQVEIAGGHCLLGETGQRSETTTFKAILESNPEVMALIPCGYYVSDILRQLEQQEFPVDWQQIEAVKTENVWALDATKYFSRPGPRVVDGVEILAKILHPKIFGQPEPHEAVRIERKMLRFSN
ncbi:MAG: cobalamin-binding protein [Acidobacteria bacterium]|nr:cobalamin-binding protein [Acidobacteriota bacterium]